MTSVQSVAPDLTIVGAARSGTSFLGGTLSRHPLIDGGDVKEPDFFSSKWERGPQWYDRLYRPRDGATKRLDASVSYTYPQHPLALERVRDANPDVQVVYTVREPLARLVSHFQLFRYYLQVKDRWADLGSAIEQSRMFLGAGDYGHWLDRLGALYPIEQVLVVPFPLLTAAPDEPIEVVLDRLDLPAPAQPITASTFRNEVRDFRSPAVRAAHRMLHGSRVYPAVRSAIGADRLRRLRQAVTKETTTPTAAQELATLTASQRARVIDRADEAAAAVTAYLAAQDERLGRSWSNAWSDHLRGAPAI